MTCNVAKLSEFLKQYNFMSDLNLHLLTGSLAKAQRKEEDHHVVSVETVENSLYFSLLSFKLEDLKCKFRYKLQVG